MNKIISASSPDHRSDGGQGEAGHSPTAGEPAGLACRDGLAARALPTTDAVAEGIGDLPTPDGESKERPNAGRGFGPRDPDHDRAQAPTGEASGNEQAERDSRLILAFIDNTFQLMELIEAALLRAGGQAFEVEFHPDVQQEIEDLKRSNELIRLVVRSLDQLKKLQNMRLRSLKFISDCFGPTTRRRRGR